jgi:hypothetical protein
MWEALVSEPHAKTYHRELCSAYYVARGMHDFMLTGNVDDIHPPMVATIAGYQVTITRNIVEEPLKVTCHQISRTNSIAVADAAWEQVCLLAYNL